MYLVSKILKLRARNAMVVLVRYHVQSCLAVQWLKGVIVVVVIVVVVVVEITKSLIRQIRAF